MRVVLLYIFAWSGELDVGCIAGSFLARLIYTLKVNKISNSNALQKLLDSVIQHEEVVLHWYNAPYCVYNHSA